MEIILKELLFASTTPAMGLFGALESLGGFSTILERAFQDLLEAQASNPRFALHEHDLGTRFRLELPELRDKLRRLVAHLEPLSMPTHRSAGGQPVPPQRMLRGIHPEVPLASRELCWSGRADLIEIGEDSVRIVDFKTGEPTESHAEQLRIYGLLWTQDEDRNSLKLAIRQLTLRYPSEDKDVPVPSHEEFKVLASDLLVRSEKARSAVAIQPPVAQPLPERCGACDVRQICDVYWEQPFWGEGLMSDAPFSDALLVLRERLAPRTWRAEIARQDLSGFHLLVHFRSAEPELKTGVRVGILSFLKRFNEETLVSLDEVGSSEWYVLP